MSATLATLLHELEPTWTIEIVERLPTVAAESSNAWNNAGTGHSALCELNYSPQRADGTVDVSKAIQVNEQFQISRQFWSHLVRTGVLPDPGTFITATPHLSFVTGEKDTEYLRARHELLKDHPLFAGIEFTDEQEQLYQWAPLMMIGRPVRQKVAATFSSAG
ncbi:MAG: malate:quinone oxidoreductase, partial [Microbacteriaceae bacterium]